MNVFDYIASSSTIDFIAISLTSMMILALLVENWKLNRSADFIESSLGQEDFRRSPVYAFLKLFTFSPSSQEDYSPEAMSSQEALSAKKSLNFQEISQVRR